MTRKVVVFGGTGFLGRRVVLHLLDHGFAVRVASRHPHRGESIFRDKISALELIRADTDEDTSTRAAIMNTFGVVLGLLLRRA